MNMVWGGLAASGRRKCDKSPESSRPGPWGYRGRLPQPYFAGLLPSRSTHLGLSPASCTGKYRIPFSRTRFRSVPPSAATSETFEWWDRPWA